MSLIPHRFYSWLFTNQLTNQPRTYVHGSNQQQIITQEHHEIAWKRETILIRGEQARTNYTLGLGEAGRNACEEVLRVMNDINQGIRHTEIIISWESESGSSMSWLLEITSELAGRRWESETSEPFALSESPSKHVPKLFSTASITLEINHPSDKLLLDEGLMTTVEITVSHLPIMNSSHFNIAIVTER